MKRILFIAVLVFSLAGCSKDDCSYDECGVVAPAAEIQSVQSYLSSNSISATQHCSGMFYIIDQQGSGEKATACGGITLHYEGKLTNGNVFDSTKVNDPAAFVLTKTVPGFKNALIQLKAGGKMRIFIPPSLGFGNVQSGTIPPNSILIFSVELLGVE
jgi:FKBP-type peptidyl-prolyl cis-trans isomerase FkpA